MQISLFIPAVLALSAAVAPAALAAGPPAPTFDIGDALKQAAPPPPPVEKRQAGPDLTQPEAPPLDLADGETLFIRDFKLEGVEFADESELLALVAPYRGSELSLGEILAAANQITTYYRSRGYLVAKAYVPQQDATGGVLTIRIVVGKYGQLKVDNTSPVADFMMEGIIEGAAAQSDAPIRKDALERAMLLISDLPGARMPKLTIAPGAVPGTSDLLVDAPPSKRVDGYVLGDNFGSRYTGRKRLNVGVAVNSPFAIGDRLSLTGVTSPAAGLQAGRAAYAFPLGVNGLRTEISAGRITYKLGDAYKDTEAEGYADVAEATISYPVIRSEAESLYATLNLGGKRLQDKVWGESTSHRKAAVSRLGLGNETKGDLFGLDLRTNASATFTMGRLSYYDSEQRESNEAGAHTVGGFTKAEFGVGGTLDFTPDLSLSTSLKTQKAIGKNLDSSEQMNISGPGAVVGYMPSIMGDNGYLYNAELQYTLPSLLDDHWHAVGLFVDTGRVYLEDAEYTTTPHSYRASDIGIAYYTRFQYSDDRYLVARLKLVENLGPTPEGTEVTPRTKLLGQLGLTF